MNVTFTPDAWEEFQYWLSTDRKTAKKISELIKDIQRSGLMSGAGKPESLKGRKEFSRRIDQYNRLVYTADENHNLLISSCKGHYDR
jgi:toxin YoeB